MLVSGFKKDRATTGFYSEESRDSRVLPSTIRERLGGLNC